LATKSSEDITDFLDKSEDEQQVYLESQEILANSTISSEKTYQSNEIQKQNILNEELNQKITSIKSLFTPQILSNNKDIADQFNLLDSLTEASAKEEVFKEILKILKKP
jgi:TRAP-type mannitol/chloroaromatic compound transport system substrate-binding protein